MPPDLTAYACVWCGVELHELDNVRLHTRCEAPYWQFMGNV